MNSKRQEADRVRMERVVREACYDLERCLVDAAWVLLPPECLEGLAYV